MRHLIYLLIILITFSQAVFSASYSIKTSASLVYTPDSLKVNVGDSVTISASSYHPLVQVSEASWLAKVATPLAGGWGVKTSAYTFIVTIPETVYFVCSSHVGLGMRGRIFVQNSTPVHDIIADAGIQIEPNPVTSTGKIDFAIGIKGELIVKLYDYSGNYVRTIYSDEAENTNNQILFDVSDLMTGIYLVAISDDAGIITKKMVVIR